MAPGEDPQSARRSAIIVWLQFLALLVGLAAFGAIVMWLRRQMG